MPKILFQKIPKKNAQCIQISDLKNLLKDEEDYNPAKYLEEEKAEEKMFVF